MGLSVSSTTHTSHVSHLCWGCSLLLGDGTFHFLEEQDEALFLCLIAPCQSVNWVLPLSWSSCLAMCQLDFQTHSSGHAYHRSRVIHPSLPCQNTNWVLPLSWSLCLAMWQLDFRTHSSGRAYHRPRVVHPSLSSMANTQRKWSSSWMLPWSWFDILSCFSVLSSIQTKI